MNEVSRPTSIAPFSKLSAASPSPSSTTATENPKSYRELSSSPRIPPTNQQGLPQVRTRDRKRKKLVKKKGSVDSFLHKVSTSCSVFFQRIRALSDEVFTNDRTVKELFVTSSDSSVDGMGFALKKAQTDIQSPEERFLEEFKNQKSLEKIYMERQRKFKETGQTDEQTRLLLQKVLKESSSSSTTDRLLLVSTTNNCDKIPFAELDFSGMRQQFERDVESSEEGTTIDGSSHLSSTPINIGETLWNFRRSKWLKTELTETEIEHKRHNKLIEEIPHELYPLIYASLVNKGKSLKDDKRMNLGDLIHVINSGWIAEEKWDRAAKGLA